MQTRHVETELYLLLGQGDMALGAHLGLWLAQLEAAQLYPCGGPVRGELHLGARHAKASDVQVQVLQGGLWTFRGQLRLCLHNKIFDLPRLSWWAVGEPASLERRYLQGQIGHLRSQRALLDGLRHLGHRRR